MSGKTRISMMGPKGEKVCLISCSGWDNQRGSIRSDPPWGVLLTLGCPTCEPRADPPAVHGAVAGAGLVHHVVEAQLLGVACTQKTEGWLSGSRGAGAGAPAAACTATHFRRWSSGLGAFLWPSWFGSACLPTTGPPSAGWRSPHPGSTMSR